jgi:hypothetical protein
MTHSTDVHIYKNYGGKKVFVLREQTELINSVPDMEIFWVLT